MQLFLFILSCIGALGAIANIIDVTIFIISYIRSRSK